MDEWIKKMYHTETVFNIKKKNLNFASDNDIHATLLLNNHPWFPVAYQLITIDTFWCSKLDKICPQIFPMFSIIVPLSCSILLLSHVWLFGPPWTIAHQAPLSWDFPGKNTGVGCQVSAKLWYILTMLHKHSGLSYFWVLLFCSLFQLELLLQSLTADTKMSPSQCHQRPCNCHLSDFHQDLSLHHLAESYHIFLPWTGLPRWY